MGKKEFATGIAKQKTVTPKALKALAKGLLDPSHPDLGGQYNDPSDPSNNVIHHIGNNKESAEGECDSVCRYVHDHLPHGSHVVVYDNPDKGINHFVHHVPTTEGTHVVDFTHRQFRSNAPFPLVEPVDRFEARRSMRSRFTNAE